MNKLRRTYQRKLNKLIKEVNKNIANDNLWRGRFEIRQKDAWFEKFLDGPGGILFTVLRLYDKKTQRFEDHDFRYAPYFSGNEWHLFKITNSFIVDYIEVWKEDPRPDKDIRDYTQQGIPAEIINMPIGEKW